MAKLTFIFDDAKFEIEDTINEHGVPLTGMEKANDHFDLPEGAWFGPSDGSPKNIWIWHRGNFFD